jgi:hypothetical protein
MREHLEEGVLDRFVGVGCIAEILIGDPKRPALMPGHEVGEPFAGGVDLAPIQQATDLDGELGIARTLRRSRPADDRSPALRGDWQWRRPVDASRNPLIHKEITLVAKNRLQFTA